MKKFDFFGATRATRQRHSKTSSTGDEDAPDAVAFPSPSPLSLKIRNVVLRQTAKMTSEFVFFSSNPLFNHLKIEKCLLLFATNTNIFTLLFKELKIDGKSFIFAVCRLT